MNRNESRYFNTAVRMDEALITLLGQKSLEYITVKDICRLADVNRCTFYLHYETIGDLLDETLDYVIRQFNGYFDESPKDVIAGITGAPLDQLVFVRQKYLVPYLNFILEHKNIYAAAYTRGSALKTNAQFESLKHYLIVPIMDRFGVPPEKREYFLAFYMQGTLAIIAQWLKNGCAEPPAQISAFIEEMCTGRIKA